jgi:hypothetical protein
LLAVLAQWEHYNLLVDQAVLALGVILAEGLHFMVEAVIQELLEEIMVGVVGEMEQQPILQQVVTVL